MNYSSDAVERYYTLLLEAAPPNPDRGLNPDSYNNYLGYSIEPQCARQTFVPPDTRPEQAFVYSKDVRNFQGSAYAWAPDFFDAAAAAAGVEFIAGVKQDLIPDFFPNITNVGFMPQAEFYSTIAKSRVVVGVGRPMTCVFSLSQSSKRWCQTKRGA
jgi:hypothetical protein